MVLAQWRQAVFAPVLLSSLTLLALLLSACARSAPRREAVQIDGLDFLNQSRSTIEVVRLLVPETGAFVSCAAIAPGAHCASGFPAVEWQGQAVEVTWSQQSELWSTGSLQLEAGQAVRDQGRARVQVVIVAPGSAGVMLVPSGDTP